MEINQAEVCRMDQNKEVSQEAVRRQGSGARQEWKTEQELHQVGAER